MGRLVERWLPGGMKAVTDRRRLVVVVAVAIAVAAIVTAIVLSTRQPVTEAPPPLPPAVNAGPAQATTAAPASPSMLVVSVVGRVARPGLVTLPGGARVADAIVAAGGALPGTNDTTLNLARRLSDGEQIYVGIPAPTQPANDSGPADDGAGPSAGAQSTVDINTADETELESLPGIGPTMAQRILTWRSQHGHFDSISQLRNVQGIGPGRFAKIAKLVTT